jgi:extradiol dioxygenase family protein
MLRPRAAGKVVGRRRVALGAGGPGGSAHYDAVMTTDPATLPPFHLAIPVHDIEAARHFYGEVLGFAQGRSDERWTDWNMAGHQVVTHQVDGHRAPVAGTNPVDGHDVPVPHFGLVLDVARFRDLADRLTEQGTDFVIAPYVRFEGTPGEQWTMFFLDPSGNAMEFKAFQDPAQLFAV